MTLLIFYILFRNIKPDDFMQNLKAMNLWYLILSIFMIFPPFYVMALRWKLMIKDFRNITAFESLKLIFVCQSINVVTPSKIGDYAKCLILRDKKFNLKIGIGAASFEKVLDLLALVIFSVIGLMLMSASKESILFITILLAALLAVIFILLSIDFNKGLIDILIRIIPFKRLRTIIRDILIYFEKVRCDMKNISTIIFLTFLGWLLHFIQAHIIFSVIGIDVPFIYSIGLLPLGILAGMIPITLAGLGTRDAVFINLFSGFADKSHLILFGLLFSLRYFIPAFIGLIWLNRSIRKIR